MGLNFMSEARFLSLAQLAAACPFMVMCHIIKGGIFFAFSALTASSAILCHVIKGGIYFAYSASIASSASMCHIIKGGFFYAYSVMIASSSMICNFIKSAFIASSVLFASSALILKLYQVGLTFPASSPSDFVFLSCLAYLESIIIYLM